MELIEEEAVRGAAYGEEYARNRVFDFAQQALDHVQKQYEIEKQKTEQSIRDIVQQSIEALETATHQHNSETIRTWPLTRPLCFGPSMPEHPENGTGEEN